MQVAEIGEAAAARGWRRWIADRLVGPLARRLPLSPRQIRTLIGLFFLFRTLAYLAQTAQEARRRT
jgi:hypothetical protein